MALNRYKLGDLIEVVDERNNLGIRDFYGININKEFMPTAANTEGLDETKYKVVRKNRFVYSGMQTGRDECIRISMYNDDTPILVSPAYTTFEVTATDVVIPLYFFMKFLSKEKDRYGAFCSDGSIRSNLDWDVFCDIELDLPPIETQKKYVNIYNAMLENQKCYERGLEDLKISCIASIEKLKKSIVSESIIPYIKERKEINSKLEYDELFGVGNGGFILPRGAREKSTFHKCNIFYPNDFVYNPSVVSKGAIAFNSRFKTPKICTEEYIVFYVINKFKLSPEYLFLWLKRKETGRYLEFINMDSVRNRVYFKDLESIKIPIPNINIQNSIAKMFIAYNERKQINEKLKAQIKNICPILIKGSIEEEKTKEV